MGFEKWDEEIHYKPDQIKQIIPAENILEEDIENVDTEKESCIIYGSSGTYKVTLEGYECYDFFYNVNF
jgi:hypothetical protein